MIWMDVPFAFTEIDLSNGQLTDVLRASLIFDTIQEVYKAIQPMDIQKALFG